MTDEQIIKEFERWVKAGRPKVWANTEESATKWIALRAVSWDASNLHYIVDDEQAELRKLQIDKPDTKFQVLLNNKWTDTTPSWFIDRKYRVKPLEWYEDPDMVGKPVWVRDEDNELWDVELFRAYDKDAEFPFYTNFDHYKQAKPVKPEDLYQEVNKGVS